MPALHGLPLPERASYIKSVKFHLRKSNTEPIIRVYSEASTMEAAEEIGQKIMDVINELAKK